MPVSYDRPLDNRVETTINKITAEWPEYSRPALKELFYNKFSDGQIGLARHLWHLWKVENMEDQGLKLKGLINSWI